MPGRKRQRTAKNDATSVKKAKLYTMAEKIGDKDETRAPMEFEDPVVFLERMRKECPNILSLMNAKQAKLLAKSPDQSYERKDVNEEYLKDMAAYYGAMQKVEDAQQAMRNSLLTPQLKTEEVDVEGFEKQTECLKKVKDGGRGLCKSWVFSGLVCTSSAWDFAPRMCKVLLHSQTSFLWEIVC